MPVENWHLTLHFIGEIERRSVQALLGEAAALDRAFSLEHPTGLEAAAVRLGGFPDPDTNGRTWALHLMDSAIIDEWRCRWREALTRCGLGTAPTATFLPHLTMARAPRQRSWPTQNLPLGLRFNRLALIDSRPAQNGAMPCYVPLSSESVSSGTS